MTTIDTLRQRRQELMERKRAELALQAQGAGDNFTLFFIEEELLDVNAQLRQLTAGRRIGNRVRSAEVRGTEIDRKLYLQWMHSQGAESDEGCQRSDLLRQVLRDADRLLTLKQREYLEDWSRGNTIERIAREHGVNQSTVSRTIKCAKDKLDTEAQRRIRMAEAKAHQENVMDLSSERTAELLLGALTTKQAMYLYLYYGEWMSLREIAELLGLSSHQTVLRSIHHALGALGGKLSVPAGTVIDFRGLGELLYRVYQQMEPEEFLPPPARETLQKLNHAPRKAGRERHNYIPLADLPHIAAQNGAAAESVWLPAGEHGQREPGRLVAALLKKKRDGGFENGNVGSWIALVIGRMKRLLGRKNKK